MFSVQVQVVTDSAYAIYNNVGAPCCDVGSSPAALAQIIIPTETVVPSKPWLQRSCTKIAACAEFVVAFNLGSLLFCHALPVPETDILFLRHLRQHGQALRASVNIALSDVEPTGR